MKKITLIIIATTLVAFSANAQKKITWGVKGGLNVTNISNMDFDGSNQRFSYLAFSFYAGAFVEWKPVRFFGVAPEVVFSKQGADISIVLRESSVSSVSTDSKLKLGYINIPVMAKFYPAKWLSIDLGPQVGFLVTAKAITLTTVEILEEPTKETSNVKSDMNTIDFGIGGGLTFYIGKYVLIQARYNLGLTEIFKGTDAFNDKTHANQVIQAGMGFRF